MGSHTLSRASRPLWFALRPSSAPKSTSIPPWRCRRCYSIQTQEEELAKLPDINPDALEITTCATPKEITPPEQLVFGRAFTGKPHVTRSSSCHAHSIPLYRSHALDRMDSRQWLARPSNNPLPKPFPRPCNLRLPLRLRMLRRHESLQEFRRRSAPLSP